MKKIIKQILIVTMCLNFCLLPVYANDPIYESINEESLDDEYFVDEDGMIVADFLTDEEILEIEKIRSENEKDSSDEISETAITYALKKVGMPYSTAKRHSGSAYDCSSLIYYSYLDSGIDLSFDGMNTAAAIANGLVNAGKEVSAEVIEPGDLIFYSNTKNGRYKNISHVAMYMGDGLQIEASSSKKKVAVRAVSYKNVTNICRPVL